jgi:hypothetical protein
MASMTTAPPASTASRPGGGQVGRARRPVVVDFLFLDLETCSRCVGTGRNLEAALESVRGLVEQTGVSFEVRRHLVDTEEMARRLRFVSSPTLRVNGRDIALELKETPCGSEPCTDGCGDGIDCRVWTHDGAEHTQAPVGLIVDALLQGIYGPERDRGLATGYELPENLRRFYAARAATRQPAGVEPEAPPFSTGRQAVEAPSEALSAASADCCQASVQQACCEPSEKATCCGSSTDQGCGCQ